MTDEQGNKPARTRTTLTGISSRAWEHPADRGALTALRKLKGFDTVMRTINGWFAQRSVRLDLLGGAVRVDERQFPRLHRLLLECCETLDAPRVPEMYVTANPVLNSMCIGLDRPIIVLNSSMVDLLDDEELRYGIGHELGHAMSGHAVYRTVLFFLVRIGSFVGAIPLGGVAVRVITAALLEWSRKSELSADRAGLLATQDPSAAYRYHMQLASGGHLADLDATAFFAQGQEYAEGGDLRETMMKLALLEQQSHPYAVVRATELRRWTETGEYTSHLAGGYPRRADDDSASASEAAQDAARSYAEAFRQTGDTLGRLLHDAAGIAGSVKGWLDQTFGRPNGGDESDGSGPESG